jgi:hypothetical protein
MRAATVLQKCLRSSLDEMHTARANVLLRSVDALVAGRRLTLMDLARSWPGAERVRVPLKALDRLLSNPHLRTERLSLCSEMASGLVRQPHPVIIVDWSDATRNRRWVLLRAAIPVGGRTLTLLDRVVPLAQVANPKIERAFLRTLKNLLPPDVTPVIVTDAGFRAPWFRAVSAMGWTWVGRLRHRTYVKPAAAPDEPGAWIGCKQLYPLASHKPRALGLMDTVRAAPLRCRMVIVGRAPAGRKDCTLRGTPRRGKLSRQNARREAEPWLIVASPKLALTPAQLTKLYARRMQIELSFRNLKSHRYGMGFEDSLTRSPQRLQILLLIQTLATFAMWLVGYACESLGFDAWLAPRATTRRLYSLVRLGREAMVRSWPTGTLTRLLEILRHPPRELQEQLGIPA